MAELETEAVRETMLAMMSMLTTRVIATSVLADELVEAADAVAGTALAAVMLNHARRYRIEVLELQGRLAVLRSTYTQRFQADP